MGEMNETNEENDRISYRVSQDGIVLTNFWMGMRVFFVPDAKNHSITQKELEEALKKGAAQELSANYLEFNRGGL
jgi:hypothetical protein